jgi:hypothetical protein
MKPDPSQQTATRPVERRAAVRCYQEGSLLCFLVVGSAHHRSATLRDVSTSGAALLVGSALEPGTALLLQVPGEDKDHLVSLPARVVRTAGQDDGSWLVGCRFASTLSQEELARAFPGAAVPT